MSLINLWSTGPETINKMQDEFSSSRPSVDTLLSHISTKEVDPLSESDLMTRRHTFQTQSRCSDFSDEAADVTEARLSSTSKQSKKSKRSKHSRKSKKSKKSKRSKESHLSKEDEDFISKKMRRAKTTTQPTTQHFFDNVDTQDIEMAKALGDSLALYEGHLDANQFQSWHRKHRKMLLSAREVLPEEIRERIRRGQKKTNMMMSTEKQKLGQSQSAREMMVFDLDQDPQLQAQRVLTEVNQQKKTRPAKRDKHKSKPKSKKRSKSKSDTRAKSGRKARGQKAKQGIGADIQQMPRTSTQTPKRETTIASNKDSLFNLKELALGDSRQMLTDAIRKLNLKSIFSQKETRVNSLNSLNERANQSDAKTIKQRTSPRNFNKHEGSEMVQENSQSGSDTTQLAFSFHKNNVSGGCYLRCTDRVDVLRSYMNSLHPTQSITPKDILEILEEIFPK